MQRIDLPTVLADLVAKQSIGHAIATLQRGLDRRDCALMKQAFHPAADVDYGFFRGSASEFCELMTGGLTPSRVTMHRPSNVWIKVRGDQAISESYVFVFSPGAGTERDAQALIGGRYLDRHERRGDEWRLSHRSYVLDWNINGPPAGLASPETDATARRGEAGPEDPGTRLLASWGVADSRISVEAGTVKISKSLAARAEIAFAKSEIHELIMAQARATDRADDKLLRSLWHPGATVDVGGFFSGSAQDYCGLVHEVARATLRMAHTVANEWVQVTQDRAVAESYVIAISTAASAQGNTDRLTGGRYLDRFACVDGAWGFTHRSFVLDWLIEQPSSDRRDDPDSMYAALTTRGGLYPDDPLYAFWND